MGAGKITVTDEMARVARATHDRASERQSLSHWKAVISSAVNGSSSDVEDREPAVHVAPHVVHAVRAAIGAGPATASTIAARAATIEASLTGELPQLQHALRMLQQTGEVAVVETSTRKLWKSAVQSTE